MTKIRLAILLGTITACRTIAPIANIDSDTEMHRPGRIDELLPLPPYYRCWWSNRAFEEGVAFYLWESANGLVVGCHNISSKEPDGGWGDWRDQGEVVRFVESTWGGSTMYTMPGSGGTITIILN